MVDWTLDYNDQDDSGDFDYLDPKKLTFAMRGDALRLTVEDDRTYLKVHAARAFPLSELNEYIGFLDAISGHEIGMIRSLRELEPQTRQMVQAAIEKRYFIPKVIHIIKAKKEFGTIYWEVDTDRGTREFVMRNIRDSMKEIEQDRFIVNDVDGNRFEVPDITKLDPRSQALWERIV